MRVLSPYEYQCKLAEEAKEDLSKYNGWRTALQVGKVIGTGLAGMAVGGFGTVGAYAAYDKFIGKGKPPPMAVVIPAAAAVGVMTGIMTKGLQDAQIKEMRNAVENYKKYRADRKQHP